MYKIFSAEANYVNEMNYTSQKELYTVLKEKFEVFDFEQLVKIYNSRVDSIEQLNREETKEIELIEADILSELDGLLFLAKEALNAGYNKNGKEIVDYEKAKKEIEDIEKVIKFFDNKQELEKIRVSTTSSSLYGILNVELSVGVKDYIIYDMQDLSDNHCVTLDGAREWLAEFWNNNPDEDMTDEEHDELIEGIMQSNYDEMIDRLSGIDYWIEELV